MRKSLIFGLLMMISCPVFAQLTEGEPVAKKIRTGNRAEEGDFGLYIGIGSNRFSFKEDAFETKNSFKISPIPLVNLKYMITDEIEARIGLEFSKQKELLKGDVFTTSGDIMTEETTNAKYKVANTDNLITPGIAYHFSRTNLLDVYAGAELPIGWTRNTVINESGDTYNKTVSGGFQIGLGAFIGLQIPIADLPFALGVEYGISSMFNTGLRYKNVYKEEGGDKETSYSPNLESLPMIKDQFNNLDGVYDSLKARKGDIGNQFRITLTYYFK